MKDKELYEIDKEDQIKQAAYEEDREVELTDEQIAQLLSQPALTLDTSNVEDIQLYDELFDDGVCEVSDVCGSISALVSVGLTPTEALDYICNRETMAYNLQLSDMNNKASIEIARINAIQAEKQSI